MTKTELCRFLEWDTNFFGYRIGRVNQNTLNEEQAREIDNWAQENNINCLYYLSEYEDESVRVAQKFNYNLQDTPITLTRKLPEQKISIPELNNFVVDNANEDDLPDLMKIIDGMFTYTRFSTDPNFSPEMTDKLYQTWLKNSVLGGQSDCVLVIRRDNKAVGFLICRLRRDEKIGNMSLLGVSLSERRSNLGSALVSLGLNYFIDEQMTISDIVTQARNIGSQRVFQKYGFRTSHIGLWYHKWY